MTERCSGWAAPEELCPCQNHLTPDTDTRCEQKDAALRHILRLCIGEVDATIRRVAEMALEI